MVAHPEVDTSVLKAVAQKSTVTRKVLSLILHEDNKELITPDVLLAIAKHKNSGADVLINVLEYWTLDKNELF